ncbi:hypothetical protein ACO0M4_11300 [Streptomyces sp. RGM 3693]
MSATANAVAGLLNLLLFFAVPVVGVLDLHDRAEGHLAWLVETMTA